MNLLPITCAEANPANELWIKAQYDRIMEQGDEQYCLVTMALKNFAEYIHRIGHEKSEEVIRFCFDRLRGCLGENEWIVRTHRAYFIVLLRCAHEEDALHTRAHLFHFAVRDPAQEAYGKQMFLEMGFYPMMKAGVDFYNAQYFADLCRVGAQRNFPETNYDIYYLCYKDTKEEFLRYDALAEGALARGDFKLYLQPKVNLRTGRVDSAEALMRWVDPQRGMIPLSTFLANIEENGFIRDVDRYLFDVACRYMERWLQKYNRKISISFNLSNAYFSGQYFMPEYTETFQKYDITPDMVCIELLESIVLNDLEKVQPLLEEIHSYGFRCALDDFGSGFSSFDVLTNPELSQLKIDRALFRNTASEREHKIVKHIIEMAHDLDMETVAEGVEDEVYVTYLKELGCDMIQGFYYYKPMPVDEFETIFVRGTEIPRGF